MTDRVLQEALDWWELELGRATLIAERENKVYRVETPDGPVALRLHRPHYRSEAELLSELDWMVALANGGLVLPRPIPARDGRLCVGIGDTFADVLSWIDGEPFGRNGRLTGKLPPHAVAEEVGRSLAMLHRLSDQWTAPEGFSRPAWDAEALVGDKPLWGRFWENPMLSSLQKDLLLEAYSDARKALGSDKSVHDYGLIHADVVPENVLIGKSGVHIIDFDDAGYGYRLFDLATTVNRLERHDSDGSLTDRFVSAYCRERQVSLAALPLFRLLRSLTYVGWIIPRLDEDGSVRRNERFIREACQIAAKFLDTRLERLHGQ